MDILRPTVKKQIPIIHSAFPKFLRATGGLLALFLLSCGVARAQVTNLFVLLPLTNVWRYDASGSDLGTEWRQPAYDDSAWSAGPGVLALEDNNVPTIALTNTLLPLRCAANQFITNF